MRKVKRLGLDIRQPEQKSQVPVIDMTKMKMTVLQAKVAMMIMVKMLSMRIQARGTTTKIYRMLYERVKFSVALVMKKNKPLSANTVKKLRKKTKLFREKEAPNKISLTG
jgi:hypothetical protein